MSQPAFTQTHDSYSPSVCRITFQLWVYTLALVVLTFQINSNNVRVLPRLSSHEPLLSLHTRNPAYGFCCVCIGARMDEVTPRRDALERPLPRRTVGFPTLQKIFVLNRW